MQALIAAAKVAVWVATGALCLVGAMALAARSLNDPLFGPRRSVDKPEVETGEKP